MPRFLPLALALLLQLAPAHSVEDSSALVQKSLVTGDDYYDQFFTPSQEELQKYWTHRTGQRVQVDGYSPDQNITIIGYGVDHERYHLSYGRDGTIMNIEGKFLKKWEPPYPMSKDLAAGPVAIIQGFEYQGKPYMVSRGEKPGTWDVYIPSMGLVKNIDDASIIREQSWRRTSSTLPPKEPSLMAVLTGRAPPGYSYHHKKLDSTTLAPQAKAKSSVETIYLDRKVETEAPPPEMPALNAGQPPVPPYFMPPYVPPMVPPPYMIPPPPQAPPAAVPVVLERKVDAEEQTPLDELRRQEWVMARKNKLAQDQGNRRLEKRGNQLEQDKELEERRKKALEKQLMQEKELEVGQKILDKHQVLEKKILQQEIGAIQKQNEQRTHLMEQKLGPMEELSESQRILKDQLRRTKNLATQLQQEKQTLSARSAQQDTKNPSKPKEARKSALMTKLFLRKKEAQREEEGAEPAAEEGAKAAAEEGAEEATEEMTEKDAVARLAEPARMRLGRKLVVLDADDNGLGFTATQFQGGYKEKLLLVESIEKDGAVAKWNREHPFQAFAQGERILQVNGEGGNSQKLQEILGEVANATKANPAKKVYLLVEKVGKPIQESFQTGFEAAKEVMQKGPRGFIREALPFHLGTVFMNKAEAVRECGDISSQLLCGMSKEKYGIECAGWSGATCLSAGEVSCNKISNEAVCNDAQKKFGITCAGWGGSSCLSKDAHPSEITSPEICAHAEKRLGILVAGWGGSSCLSRSATCSQITLPGLCKSADSKLGIKCVGWGGSSCLEPASKAELITVEHLCKKSMETFGIESVGWGGDHCLSKEGFKCDLITDPAICNDAEARLGKKCAGWGGSSCLETGAGVELITADSICQKSMQLLGIESAGWSGIKCLPAGTVKCSDIERPGVCNSASTRLGIKCAGWTGNACLSTEEMKCNRVTVKHLCETSVERFSLPCVWNGDMCLPDTSPAH